MKRILFKLISLALALALVSQILPQQVYAEAGLGAGNNAEALDDYSVSPSQVACEVKDLRSEGGKHFMLTDGTYLSVEYYEPVHYEDEEGIWQDIDNTLFLDKDTNTYKTAVNGKSSYSFLKDLSAGDLFSVSYGEYEASVKLAGEDFNKDSSIEIKEVQKEEKDPSMIGWSASDLVPPALTCKLTYKDAYEGTDLEYTLNGYDLKECIKVNERGEEYCYSFLLELKGLEDRLNDDRSVSLLSADGEEIYKIPAPFMQDEEGALSFDVEYILSETDEGTLLTIEADADWINSEERAFPVVIDPTFKASAANNTYTSSSNI